MWMPLDFVLSHLALSAGVSLSHNCPFFFAEPAPKLSVQGMVFDCALNYVLVANSEYGTEFVLGVLLSTLIRSKGNPSGTHFEFFQMVSLLPDSAFSRSEKNKNK